MWLLEFEFDHELQLWSPCSGVACGKGQDCQEKEKLPSVLAHEGQLRWENENGGNDSLVSATPNQNLHQPGQLRLVSH